MIYQIFGTDAHEMTKALLEQWGTAGKIPSGAPVVLKPNLVVAQPPELGATTHAGVLSGCIEYLRDCGVSDISIIEGSWVGDQTRRAAAVCGYDRISKRYGVPFYDLKKDSTRKVQTPLRPMELCCRALDAGFFIDLPVLKGHCQTRMTCALKNLKGCIPDREKRKFHVEGLMKPIAALASVLKPNLIVVDNICGDLDFEEGGNPVQSERMYLGCDPVQVDAYGCQLMGIPLSQVPYIQLAEQWGAGSSQVGPDDIISLNQPTVHSGSLHPSGVVAQLTQGVLQNQACSACYASLVRALYELQREGISIHKAIHIGQGWRGQSGPGIGIGSCCSKMAHCIRGCPPTSEEVKRQLTLFSQADPVV